MLVDHPVVTSSGRHGDMDLQAITIMLVKADDYDEFDLANENDELEKFLKVPVSSPAAGTVNVENGHVANGNTSSRENSAEKDAGDQQVPER
ncbi:hypothetical protein J6590_003179 [Homalodisca vitripennis]|nr:hypothetical protein J6590_003179 [Homalodisca vitripennis]